MSFQDGTVTNQIDGGIGNLTLEGNTINFVGGTTSSDLLGEGTLFIQPIAQNRNIRISDGTGGTSINTLELFQSLLDEISSDFNNIEIGQESSTGTVAVQSAFFNHPVTIQGGEIQVGSIDNFGNLVELIANSSNGASGEISIESINTSASGSSNGGDIIIIGASVIFPELGNLGFSETRLDPAAFDEGLLAGAAGRCPRRGRAPTVGLHR